METLAKVRLCRDLGAIVRASVLIRPRGPRDCVPILQPMPGFAHISGPVRLRSRCVGRYTKRFKTPAKRTGSILPVHKMDWPMILQTKMPRTLHPPIITTASALKKWQNLTTILIRRDNRTLRAIFRFGEETPV
jgi:hypothetical protein